MEITADIGLGQTPQGAYHKLSVYEIRLMPLAHRDYSDG
jgi:hypothetical protein